MNEALKEQRVERIGGRPENALSNNFKLESNEILKEAWELSKTTKLPYLLAALIIYFITLAASFITEPMQAEVSPVGDISDLPWAFVASQLVMQVVLAVLLAGLISMGLRNAVRYVRSNTNEVTLVPENKASMVFSQVSRAWPIVAIELTKMLGLVVMGSVGLTLARLLGLSPNTLLGLFVVVGMTFGVALSLAVPLVIQDQLKPFKAIRVSLRIVFRRFNVFLTIYAVMFILAVVSIFTFGIGFIWSIPMFYNAKGILYREIFGIETHVLVSNENREV